MFSDGKAKLSGFNPIAIYFMYSVNRGRLDWPTTFFTELEIWIRLPESRQIYKSRNLFCLVGEIYDLRQTFLFHSAFLFL